MVNQLLRSKLRQLYLSFFGAISRPKNGIYFFNSHYITPMLVERSDENILREFLSEISHFSILLTPLEAIELLEETKGRVDEVYVCFTFDDGFEECFTQIAGCLEDFGTRGAFFVNANYIESNVEYQEHFNQRIKISTKQPMSWSQLRDLHRRGHMIGSHGLDHYNFSRISNKDVKWQIEENKRVLEHELQFECDTFAWTYGGKNDFNEYALNVASDCNKYIFSSDIW